MIVYAYTCAYTVGWVGVYYRIIESKNLGNCAITFAEFIIPLCG